MARRNQYRSGFTLIELVAVMAVMVLILGIAMPQLWPLIAFAGLEGEASRLANYGRVSVARCTLMREHYIIKVDFAKQKYWAVLQPSQADLEGNVEAEEKVTENPEEEFNAFATLKDVDPLERANQFRDHMEAFMRTAVEVRASRVEQDDFSLEDVGPEFEEFELDPGADEEYTVKLNLIEPHTLPSEVTLESVEVGGKLLTQGTAEIEILPLGLLENATFYLKGESGEYYTVIWDAITGGARVYAGKEDAGDEEDAA